MTSTTGYISNRLTHSRETKLTSSLPKQSWLYGCNIQSPAGARIVHVMLFFFLIIIILCYFTGESLFSSFFPLESSPFFFLFARSWESRASRVSSGMRGPLEGLRGLMVPGRRGRTIGDGARTGATLSLSTVSVVSVVAWGERRWGRCGGMGVGVGGSALQKKQPVHTADKASVCLSFCLSAELHYLPLTVWRNLWKCLRRDFFECLKPLHSPRPHLSYPQWAEVRSLNT